MPTNRELASELWLHLNSPETLDKTVGAELARLRREARGDELADYQNERKELDDAVERLQNSPSFERYKQTFLEAENRDSPELERAVSAINRELKLGTPASEISARGREQCAAEVAADVESLGASLEQVAEHAEHEPER